MPTDSGGSGSGSWRKFLDREDSVGDGSNQPAADAPSGEPGPAAVRGIPDLNFPPPLEPQGVSLEEILEVRGRLRDLFQSLNVFGFPPNEEFMGDIFQRVDLRPGISSTRLEALSTLMGEVPEMGKDGRPPSWTTAVSYLQKGMANWDGLHRGQAQSDSDFFKEREAGGWEEGRWERAEREQSKFQWRAVFMVPYSPLCHCLTFGCLITLEIMYLLIVFLPLLGSSVAGFFGRFLGSEGTAIVTTTCVSFSSILSLIAFYEVAPGASACYLRIAPWISSEMFDASWGFFGDRELARFADWSDSSFTSDSVFDSPTVVMLIVVTFISSLVHLYSISYMSEDPHSPRFMCYLSILTFFMPMLVTGDNSLQLFLGWEGVGLASYLLIHFWFTRLQADKAAIKAMLVNRVGDFGLALGISGCFTLFQTVDFSTIFACAGAPRNSWIFCNMRLNAITLICILLFIGAVGKSAQIGSHTWSPDAMEGPTPVSALIHAATMVTAGVFMIARCSPLFEYPPTALIVITFAGAMTSFLAATTGILQNDLKRVIAYSTCSQLGYMIFAYGISNYSVSVFHLMNHAFFKALLFLSAGSVIHAMSDEQDMRKMGGLASSFPFTYAMMLMGSLSLIGFPFLTGFYSKDVILELAYT
ncbi:NADH-ubiquinone oxidoreductase chain 5, partial [Bienertia sinuspersici]